MLKVLRTLVLFPDQRSGTLVTARPMNRSPRTANLQRVAAREQASLRQR
jgi:hypothetical protein